MAFEINLLYLVLRVATEMRQWGVVKHITSNKMRVIILCKYRYSVLRNSTYIYMDGILLYSNVWCGI